MINGNFNQKVKVLHYQLTNGIESTLDLSIPECSVSYNAYASNADRVQGITHDIVVRIPSTGGLVSMISINDVVTVGAVKYKITEAANNTLAPRGKHIRASGARL